MEHLLDSVKSNFTKKEDFCNFISSSDYLLAENSNNNRNPEIIFQKSLAEKCGYIRDEADNYHFKLDPAFSTTLEKLEFFNDHPAYSWGNREKDIDILANERDRWLHHLLIKSKIGRIKETTIRLPNKYTFKAIKRAGGSDRLLNVFLQNDNNISNISKSDLRSLDKLETIINIINNILDLKLDLTASEHEICRQATKNAHDFQAKYENEPFLDPEQKRELNPLWHRRKIRRQINSMAGWLAWVLGLTGGEKGYIADYVKQRVIEKDRNARKFLENHFVMRKADGRIVASLAEVHDANLKQRVAAFWAISEGCDKKAATLDYSTVLVTLTLPPEYHPCPSKGRNSYNPAISPKHAFDEMQSRWERIRANFAKQKLAGFGFWTAEPHQDGCPHRHLILYAPADQLAAYERIIADQFPDPPDRAPGDKPIAYDFKIIEKDEDNATLGYVRYYVMKQIAGSDITPSENGSRTSDDQIERMSDFQAWKSAHGVRGFGFFGFNYGFVGVWQDINRLSRREEVIECPETERVAAAMRDKDYSRALTLMGVFKCENGEEYTKPFESMFLDHDDNGEVLINQYVEEIKKRIGFVCLITGNEFRTKFDEYEIVDKTTKEASDDYYNNQVTVNGKSPKGEGRFAHPPPFRDG